MTQIHTDTFLPPFFLRNAFLQTVLSSSKLRAVGPDPLKGASRMMILDAGNGVRLQGFHTPQRGGNPKGLVILIHGWEGSAESTYMFHTGRHLFLHGYDVFRLNLRDHGDTHHLNRGLFYGTLLDEAYEAVKQAANLRRSGNCFLVGFSLGGNFSLRIARRLGERHETFLTHVTAISPVLDPSRTTDAIDHNPLLHWYFMKKWKRSLKKKQGLYPDLYDFGDILSLKNIREMTDALIAASGLYTDAKEYFSGYTITDGFLMAVTVPMTIVIARDDPAIPVDDFHRLRLPSPHRLIMHRYGGHNGFLYGPWAPTWYEKELVRTFQAI